MYYPPEPNSVLRARYLTPSSFVVSMDGYDAGYLYECVFPSNEDVSDPDSPTRPVQAVPVQGILIYTLKKYSSLMKRR